MWTLILPFWASYWIWNTQPDLDMVSDVSRLSKESWKSLFPLTRVEKAGKGINFTLWEVVSRACRYLPACGKPRGEPRPLWRQSVLVILPALKANVTSVSRVRTFRGRLITFMVCTQTSMKHGDCYLKGLFTSWGTHGNAQNRKGKDNSLQY